MKVKIKNWFLVFLWAGFIFFLSHQPELKSGLPGPWDFVLRKLAHISEYAVLTFLLIRALQEHQISQKRVFWLAIVLAILYALSDEYHQSFILGRQAALSDVLIDSSGVFLIICLSKFLNRK